jgi:heme A synthase
VPAILYPAVLIFVLILVQGGLGGAAVVNELPPEIVAVHLSMALAIFALLLLVTATSFALASAPPHISISSTFGRIALAAAAATLLLMIVGSYVSGAGYGLACNGWPLCNGEVVPSAQTASVQLHFLHRFLALVLGVILVALAGQAWRERGTAPYLVPFATVALVVYVAQALVGAANIWTELSEGVGAAHLALATLLWTLLVLLNIRVHRLYELLPHSQDTRPRSDLLGVSR